MQNYKIILSFEEEELFDILTAFLYEKFDKMKEMKRNVLSMDRPVSIRVPDARQVAIIRQATTVHEIIVVRHAWCHEEEKKTAAASSIDHRMVDGTGRRNLLPRRRGI